MPYRKSAIRHPLARVRFIIGLGQSAVANRVKCSPITIKRIEQGTLALSRPLADRLEAQLGVSAAYLRHGRASQPPTTPTGETFTKHTFDHRKKELLEKTLIQSAAFFPFRWAAKLGAIASKAGDENRLLAFHYKVEALALELEKEFGIDCEEHKKLKRICSGSGLLTVGAHDEKMPPNTFAQLAHMDGLPYRATTKTKTTRLRPDAAEAAKAFDKLQAKRARR